VVFLIVGRTELFTENFFDPVAAAVSSPQGRDWSRLLRLWVTTLVFNLVGGAVLIAVMTVEGCAATRVAGHPDRVGPPCQASVEHSPASN
jgi:formate/nitrite transporter FocA (FNT family)